MWVSSRRPKERWEAGEGEEQSHHSLQASVEEAGVEVRCHHQEAAEGECQSFHQEGEVVEEDQGYPWHHQAEAEEE
jgi:hypothetical protein